MKIQIAQTDEEIAACFGVMKQLRPKLDERRFVSDIRRMQKGGYILLALADPDVCAVAGYRFFEMLFAEGMTLYVDDLVTDSARRSHGYGKALLSWLIAEAQKKNCKFLTLDSGLKRLDAHRFYRREGMQDMAIHFAIPTDGGPMWTSE